MQIVEQCVELMATTHPVSGTPSRFLERCGRVAWQSQDKIGPNTDRSMLEMLRKKKHLSVLEHLVCTIIGTTNRGVSHELVRHRIASYTQSSTRYVDESNMCVITPSWFSRFEDSDERTKIQDQWEAAMLSAERNYVMLREMGCQKQEARDVLPQSLATEIVITMNAREWLHFFDLRTAKDAHPDMQLFAGMCRELLIDYYPDLFSVYKED